MMREFKGSDNNQVDNLNPERGMDTQIKYPGATRIETYDPDKRIESRNFEVTRSEDHFNKFKELADNINESLEGKNVRDIIVTPFEKFITVTKEASLDALVMAAGYLTSCKLACAELVDNIDIIEKGKEGVDGFIKKSLDSFFSINEFADKYIQEYGIAPNKIGETIQQIAEYALELGKAINYIETRIVLGVVGIIENAFRAVFSMGIYAFGKSDVAKEVMTESYLDQFRDYLDRCIEPDDMLKKIGDIADKASEVVGELALGIIGAIGLAAVSPAVAVGIIASAGILAFDAAGKSLKKNIEKSGEYGKKEFISALITAGVTLTVERIMPCIAEIANEANILKAAGKVSQFAKGNMELGSKLTKALISSIQSGLGAGVFKGGEEIKKIADYGLGISETYDIVDGVSSTIACIFGGAALGGGLSYAGDTILKSKTFQELAKKFDTNYKPKESIYDVLYKEVQLTKEYYADLLSKSAAPEFINNLPDPEKIFRESRDAISQNRDLFDNKKNTLIKEWEKNTGKEWPRYKEDLYIDLDNGVKAMIRKAGYRYDAHHIVPLKLGGENVWDNITPITAELHYDHKGIHDPNGPLERLAKILEGKL